jgi:hypothetical protein
MTYVVSCPASLQGQCLIELLALPAESRTLLADPRYAPTGNGYLPRYGGGALWSNRHFANEITGRKILPPKLPEISLQLLH